MPRIAIVGAGIIGSHIALAVNRLRPDAEILILDRAPDRYDGASVGNMAGFATSEVRPLATLQNIFRGMAWMLDPLAPFTLRPRSIPTLAPWISRFLRSAVSPGHTQHVIEAQQALMSRAHAAHVAALRGTGLDDLISSEGALVLYKNDARMRKDWDSRWRLFREQGDACIHLSEEELRQLLPCLSPTIQCGISVPSIKFWQSPLRLLRGLHEVLQARGISIQRGDVAKVETNGKSAQKLLLGSGQSVAFDRLIVAAGAWSKSLCADIGDNVPLDSERGYSTTIQGSGVEVSNLLLFPDDEFVATPLSEGLRLGGTVELADFDTPPNFARTDILASAIKDYFPEIDVSDRDEWMGNRPSLPDGLPVIGNSPTCYNVTYAFGHGHVGMTQSAITGRLVAEMLAGQDSEIDLKPYSIGRFG